MALDVVELRAFYETALGEVARRVVTRMLRARWEDHAGLRVLAFSLITNMGCGLSDERLSHAHTLAGAEAAAVQATRLLQAVLPRIAACS